MDKPGSPPLVTLRLTIDHMREEIMMRLTNYQVPELGAMIDSEITAFFQTERFQREIKEQVANTLKAELQNGIRQAVQHVFYNEGVREALYPKLIKAIADSLRNEAT